MSQPTSYGGRPMMPAPGTPPPPERRVARVRRHGRILLLPALVLIGVVGATGYFWGNLPAPVSEWPFADAVLLGAASLVVLVCCLLPLLSWLARSWTITTRRVIERSGVFTAGRREFSHARGYTVSERRGPLQRMLGSGTLSLANGLDRPMVLRDIPLTGLVHEVLADQVEVGQMMAHRDALATSAIPTTGIPPRPPLPAG